MEKTCLIKTMSINRQVPNMNNYIFGVPNNLCVQLSPSSFKQVDPVEFTDWNNSRIFNMPGPWPFLAFVVRPQCRLFTSFYFVNFLRVGVRLLENLGLKPKSLVRGWNCLVQDPAWLPRQRWDWPSLPQAIKRTHPKSQLRLDHLPHYEASRRPIHYASADARQR